MSARRERLKDEREFTELRRINSRLKGASGEREAARFWTDQGWPARRGRQYSGSPDSPDIASSSEQGRPLHDRLHFEVKKTERLSLYQAMDQARGDCGEKIPVVMHRRNNREWLVILRATDFAGLVREALG